MVPRTGAARAEGSIANQEFLGPISVSEWSRRAQAVQVRGGGSGRVLGDRAVSEVGRRSARVAAGAKLVNHDVGGGGQLELRS